ncbi:unnamed protein product [Dracunculus medinensis]|uniref:Mitogen-activated protein kinase kinase kinase n=1 Tax=Dracunculus medinensis TaxID=318479 RepID=A0A0N4UHU1_DRAME|nr:unnamed protein product [Dracunculus medinensis]
MFVLSSCQKSLTDPSIQSTSNLPSTIIEFPNNDLNSNNSSRTIANNDNVNNNNNNNNIDNSDNSKNIENNFQNIMANSSIDTIYQGLFSCFKPMWTYFGRSAQSLSNEIIKSSSSTYNRWEIAFELITDLDWLGSGSQGAVFMGKLNDEVVAVKKVKNIEETNIKHLQHLNHDNVIKFKGVCVQSPCFCIIMEYCEQGQLYEVLKNGRQIERDKFAEWSRQIADGMNYLHQKKIIHRDLKSPNILVDSKDVLKICDFGTSHQWNRQKSTVMSFCGTAAWMAPEIIKKEPCSEKVDIWSFGVVLWELLTQEIPYKDVDSMAIIWGVGSNNLSLPIPETAPEGLKLLLRQCWSIKPRNRPSFLHILTHIAVFKSEIANISDTEWINKKQSWKDSVIEYMRSIRQDKPINQQKEAQNERELLQKRREELRHAQDIREMYEDKMRRASRMYSKLTFCLNELAERERDLNERERWLLERERFLSRYGIFSNNPRAYHCTTKIRKSMGVRAAPELINGCIGSGKQNVYPFLTNRATLRYEESEDMSSSDEDFHPVPEYICSNSPTRCSFGSSAMPLSQTASISFSRQSSSVSSAQNRLSNKISPSLQRNTSNDRNISRDSSKLYGSFNFQTDLQRGSPARNSGYSEISIDSGFHNLLDNDVSGSGTQECNCCAHCGQPIRPANLYRNVEGRWSDGRLTATHKKRNRKGSIVFCRDSSQRSTPARSKDKRSSYPRSRQSTTDHDSSTNIPKQFSPSPEDRILDHDNKTQRPQNEPNNDRTYSSVGFQKSLCQSNSYQEALRNESSSCSLAQASDTHSEKDEIICGELLNGQNDSVAVISDASAEESSDDKDLCNESNNVLITSSSTMESSLERSLEMAAIHSDGLSDKERQVRAVKNTIKTHRRTGSNPLSIPSVVCETSTESEGEVVYC